MWNLWDEISCKFPRFPPQVVQSAYGFSRENKTETARRPVWLS